MLIRIIISGLLLFFLIINTGKSQTGTEGSNNDFSTGGYIKVGFYSDLNRHYEKPLFSAGYSEVRLKLESGVTKNFKASSDLRFKYGSEFNNPVNSLNIKEAFVSISLSSFSFSAGQQVIKWGRTDFTNTISKLNPQNYITRSPDKEDMDMGNIIVATTWYPSPVFNIQAIFVPFYRPSVLLIEPVPVPEGVRIEQMRTLVIDKSYPGYGLRADIHLRGTDLGLTWFDGYDPMPGIRLEEFSLDMSGPNLSAVTKLKATPYKIKAAGIDFESVIDQFGLRGEVAYSRPYPDFSKNEYVPMPEIKWVTDFEYNPGNWRIIFEYSGKYIPSFKPIAVEPIIGTEPDYEKLAELISQPDFDIMRYIKDQTGAFNRLYNYQLERTCHSAGLRIEKEFVYGKIIPAAFGVYNFTTGELLFIPEIKIKPYDGLTITAGAELYSGSKSSLFNLIDDFMESFYTGLKVDF